MKTQLRRRVGRQQSRVGPLKPAAPAAPAAPAPAPAPSSAGGRDRRGYVPRDVKVLVRAIFARTDPVDVATNLLRGEGDATMAKTFALLMEYLYGKPVQPYDAGGPGDPERFGARPFQFATHVPRPYQSGGASQVAAEPRSATEDENDGHE
jgi:hypothetical protein